MIRIYIYGESGDCAVVIKASAVFFLLSERRSIIYDKEAEADTSLEQTCIYSGGLLTPGTLYVVDWDEYLTFSSNAACAFVVADPLAECILAGDGSAPVAFATGSVSKTDLLSDILKIFLALQTWDCDLKDAFHGGYDLFNVLDVGRRMFDHPLVIIDRFFARVAYTGDYIEKLGIVASNIERVPIENLTGLFGENGFLNTLENDQPFIYSLDQYEDMRICKHIHSNGRYIARLVAHFIDPDITKGELELFLNIVKYVEMILTQYSRLAINLRPADSLHNLLEKLLKNKDATADELTFALRNQSWKAGHSYSIILLEFADCATSNAILLYVADMLEERIAHLKSIVGESCIFCMVNHVMGKIDGEEFLRFLGGVAGDTGFQAGVSDTFSNLATMGNLKDYLLQARLALSYGKKNSPDLPLYLFSHFKIDYIMDQLVGDFQVEQISHAALLTLIKYDSLSGTEYVKTLYYYLFHKCNLSVTAKALYVHRTTLIRRLEKINDLTKLSLDDMDDLIHLLVSFRIFGFVKAFPLARPDSRDWDDAGFTGGSSFL